MNKTNIRKKRDGLSDLILFASDLAAAYTESDIDHIDTD